MTTLKILFWLCLAIVFYTYIGYGLLLYILVRLKRLLGLSRPEPVLPELYPPVPTGPVPYFPTTTICRT